MEPITSVDIDQDHKPITSIKQFLDERLGVETFYEYGRALYKYTFGPWIVALVAAINDDGEDHSREIYYEGEEARKTDWFPNCVGLKVGSIIEGADYDATPFILFFPFTMAEYDTKLKELEEEVNAEWVKNNSSYYKVREAGNEKALTCAMWTEFDDKPKLAEEELETLVIAGVEELNKDCPPYDKWIPFEFKGKQYEICEYQEVWY